MWYNQSNPPLSVCRRKVPIAGMVEEKDPPLLSAVLRDRAPADDSAGVAERENHLHWT